MTTRYGRQPARVILFTLGISVTEAARRIHVEHAHLAKTLAGHVTPSPDVRARLPRLLKRPLEECFTPEVLARKYWHKAGAK